MNMFLLGAKHATMALHISKSVQLSNPLCIAYRRALRDTEGLDGYSRLSMSPRQQVQVIELH
jgi:hypothetical protein